ncbi:cell wall-binding repeat-containing protein [Clostridium tyrobutyricum]|uniref:cell wall-binding repeat-containing protein n=1 Tax=Clostridium tyrobutyricum TaxID=1519 RepID=UPI00068A9A38|nr:cell wall-binding repeat-containing protein [Clostridium tyrobutyricum]
MNKKGTKALASATLMSLVLTTALATGNVKAAANGQATRVGGTDRYETAAKVATANFTTSENVVLVSGEGYADSVSASVLAKKLNAPIVLTGSKTLDANAKSAIETLKAKNVYIIGGTGSISASIETGLKSDYTVTRLGGQDRYATNLAIANKLVDLGVSKSNIIAVAGTGFADALSVAPVAAADNEILLLTNNNADTMKNTAEFAKNSNVTVVGTTNVVSDSIYNQLKADKRINGGDTRFETNINVLNAFDKDLKADKLYVASATQANPDNLYADALVASAIAGKYAAPLVLTDTEGSTGTTNAISYIGTKATKATDLQVVGGTGVVSDATVTAIENAIKDKDTDPEVSSIEAQNLNQIKVTFNTAIDKDSAEDVTNYKIDGSDLTALDGNDTAIDENGARAKAVDDHTVIITLAKAKDQFKDVTVTVKKGILNEDKTKTVPEFEKNVTFSDTTAPTLSSVTVQGNTKITVQFSEAVNLGNGNINNIANKFKIDGQSIKNYGLDTTNTKIKDKLVDQSGDVWSNKIEFYFNSTLSTGSHTLKISDGDTNGILSDAAKFIFKEATQSFDVDTNTTDPSIKNVTVQPNGEIDVEFDRPMDTTTFNASQWKLNNNSLASYGFTKANDFDTDNNDTIIELKNLGNNVKVGANTIYVDKNMKDAYGNKIPDDTNVSFNYSKDTTKPTVSSITPIDSETVRVRFSKDVKYSYATNKSNYKLLDNKGYDISSHIDKIESAKGSSNTDDTDTYNIKIYKSNPSDSTENWSLTTSTYTLTVKNVVDATPNANVMNDYTETFTGVDTVAPKVSSVNANFATNANDKDKVVVYFSKPMDVDSITNKSNYQYTTPNGDVKSLPSSATISAGGDNKSAIIELPTSYRISGNTNVSTVSDSNTLKSLTILNVKDEGGNTVSDKQNIVKQVVGTTTVKDNSIVVKSDGDDVKVDIQFNKAIDNLNKGDFTFAGVQADAASVNGSTVTLTFKDSVITPGNTLSNAKVVKAAGVDGQLAITGPTTTDESGAKIVALVAGAIPKSQVYDYKVAPKTLDAEDNWTVVKDSTGKATVNVKFDTKLDKNSGVKVDDFVFNCNGKNINATDANIVDKSNTVTFTLDPSDVTAAGSDFANGKKLSVRAKSTVSIRTATDRDNGNVSYVPSDDDTKDNLINISVYAPAIDATAAQGTATGSTAITATLPSGANGFKYKVGTSATAAPKIGDALPAGTTSYSSGNDIAGVDDSTNKYVDLYAVDGDGNIVGFTEITLTAANIK